MPTIAQLVRKGREDKIYKSKSPSLNVGFKFALLTLVYTLFLVLLFDEL